MKAYRKKLNVTCSATANTPLYFDIDSVNDPKDNEEVTIVYDRNGEYLGFTTDRDAVRKYLYGKLYYKTKGKYRIGRMSYGRRAGKILIEKATGLHGLYLVEKTFGPRDLIDMDLPGAKAKLQLADFEKSQGITAYTFNYGINDPHGYLTAVNIDMKKEFQQLIEKYNNRVKETLSAIIEGEQAFVDLSLLMTEDTGTEQVTEQVA